MSVLKYRDPSSGEWIPVPNKGEDGKSAYEYAKDAGYAGTEAEFSEKLVEEAPIPDWNDLTNRPFYEEENAVLLPPTQLIGGLVANALVAMGSTVELVDGRTYTINWNGVDYEAVCYMAQTSFAADKVPVVGNPLPQGGADNGLPFVIGGNEQGVMAWPLDGSTAATVGITGYAIHRLDPKYIPDEHINSLIDTKLAAIPNASGVSF